MHVSRFDRSELRKPTRTREGWLRADGHLTRCGVFEYRLGDGSVRRELRHPDEVFHADALESFTLVPLTREHPSAAVTAENWRDVAVGTVGEVVRRDGDFVRATLVFHDPKAIADLEKRDRQELSCGYTCELVMDAGEWQGQKYDARQTNIRGNHVALVSKGRAGPQVRVRLDAADGLDASLGQDTDDAGDGTSGGHSMVKYRVDGVEYDVSEQAKQALEREAGRRDAETERLKKEIQERADTLGDVEAKRAELEKKLAASEKARADAVDPKKVAEVVRARVALERQVAPHLGNLKLDDMTDRDIRVALLQKLNKDFKSDGVSDDYLNGRFEGALDLLKTRPAASPVAAARAAVTPAGRSDATMDASDPVAAARARMVQEAREAWKKKPAA